MSRAICGMSRALFDSDLIATRLALFIAEALWATMLFWPGDTFERPTYSAMGVIAPELDGHWQIHSVEPWYFGLVVRRNVGVKLSMAVPGLRRRAPLVLIKFSLISGK